MTLNCVLCDRVIDGSGDGHVYACMRRMARNRTIRIVFKILKFLGVCRK